MPKVLIAEDDQLVRHFLADALRAGGYDVVSCHDGQWAMRFLSEGPGFDVVVTDHTMPGADGIAVIEHAARVDPRLPCIIVTAHSDLDLAMRGMAAGAVGFLPKPFKPRHLLAMVGTALERRRAAEEAHRLSVVTPMLERFTLVLGNTLESKDAATQKHAERLVNAADGIAAHMGLGSDLRLTIRLGACLHDIGKVGVPEQLLRKPGPLTDEEMAVMRRHPDIGAQILEDVDTWEGVRLIVRHHHEHWNGGGYPLGLAGTGIPLGARIVNVVDAFDVMRTGRPYAPALNLDQTLSEIAMCRGVQFDPDVVDAFMATLDPDGDYHDPVHTRSELSLIARRADHVSADSQAVTRRTVGVPAA